MKKLLIILVIVLLVVFGLAPSLVGGRAQNQYEQIVEQLRAGGAQVTSVKYDRGWFGAKADTELVIPLPPAAAEIPEFPRELRVSLASTLHHGPLTSLGGVGLAEIDTRILLNGRELFPADYPVRLRTLVALDGATRTLLDLPATRFPAEGDRPELDFRGLSGILNVDAGFNRVDTRLESPGARVAGGRIEALDIGTITLDSKASRGISDLMLGDARIAISHLRLDGLGDGDALALNQIFVEGLSSADGEMVTGSARYHVGTVKFGEQEFREAELKISAGNLSAPVLAQIQKALDEIQSRRIDPEMQGAAIMTTLVTQLPLLLEHDPVIAIDTLRVDTADGRVEGRFKVQARDMRWEDLQGDTGFMRKLQASGELKMPETLFRGLLRVRTENEINRELALRRELGEEVEVPPQPKLSRLIDRMADQQLAALLEQRLIVRDGGHVASSADYEEGRLTVNGEQIPLPFLPPAQ